MGTRSVGVTIWTLLAAIFLFDVLTPPENISVCFAYVIPVFLSLFESKPHPFLYAATATALSLVGSLIQPSGDLPTGAVIANRLIAVATQWLGAILVRVQYHRHADMQREAEFQRRFVDILSHEIGTALTTIAGQAYRLTKLSAQLAPSDLRVRVEKIRNAAQRIEAIVNRVQFASALGDGTIPIGHHSIDLNTVLRQLTDQLNEEQRGRPIELNMSPESQVVNGDEMLLYRAFENVIVNSVKYSSGDAPIVVSIAGHGPTSRITIADRGNGIPLHELSQVREPYYRGQSSKGTSGAGLGLYFVERIVAAHGGKLVIESQLGKGTKVIIELSRTVEFAAL